MQIAGVAANQTAANQTAANHVPQETGFVGCYKQREDDVDPISELRDTMCKEGRLAPHHEPYFTPSDPCRSGLPFFRKKVDPAKATQECFDFCKGKGLDFFGLLNARSECRCGASSENVDFWGNHSNFDMAALRGLTLSAEKMSWEEGAGCKGVEVWQYVAWKEEPSSSGTGDLLKARSVEDQHYMTAILSR